MSNDLTDEEKALLSGAHLPGDDAKKKPLASKKKEEKADQPTGPSGSTGASGPSADATGPTGASGSGSLIPAQYEDDSDGWGDTPVQMRG